MGQITVEKNVGGIEGLCVITPAVHGDNRGYFMETYSQRDMEEAGINIVFVQDNQSCSTNPKVCQKSDRLIVVMKPLKAGGAKGSANSRSQSGNVHGTGGRCCMEMQAEGIRFQSAKYERVQNLMQRMRKFQYKPLPVKRVYIPKGNGKTRPLGLPSYEDKLVQGVMAKLLNEVYDTILHSIY